jgi:hypothetical protein
MKSVTKVMPSVSNEDSALNFLHSVTSTTEFLEVVRCNGDNATAHST